MRLSNSGQRYGAVAIVLHWLMAALIVTLASLGLYMVRLPDAGFDTWKILLILVHKEIGVAVLPLAAVRLIWRQLNPLPGIADTTPEWQKVIAFLVQLCFYALMLALQITGLVMSSASGIPVSFLGLFALPDLVPHDDAMFGWLRTLHDKLGYTMAGLICLHAGAALWHHVRLRDNTLRKMLWHPDV
jgi:cytochrome b561